MHSLIIFASGRGSNAEKIIEYFKAGNRAKVSLIVSNKQDAGVLGIAKRENIPFHIIDKDTIKSVEFIDLLNTYNPSLIVLAGFLWKIPDALVAQFNNKIINIHPSLLPKYGGKGMYGQHVHEAVINASEKESGITIHYVNNEYDKGNIILQAHCNVSSTDDANKLADKVHQLEHYYFPLAIDYILKS